MRRLTGFLVRNWPLKLGAIVLATVLYSGLVLGQNVRTFKGEVPVQVFRQPAGSTLLADLEPVTSIRYRAPLDVGVLSPASFHASADLSRVEVTEDGAAQEVPITLIAFDSEIQIVDFEPRTLQVRLDPVAERTLPIDVDVGVVPDGLSISPPQTDPSVVNVQGASSRVDQVAKVEARVAIDASAINIDRSFELVPIDSAGNQVPNVELDPARARVRIAVARELTNRSLPLVPQVVGVPAPGYRIASIMAEPLVVTVSGEAAAVTQMEVAQSEPIDISGRTDDLEATVRVAVPPGVSVSGDDTVRVMITIDQEVGTRTFEVGLQTAGDGAALNYSLSAPSVDVTLAGPVAVLDTVDPTALVATVDVLQVPDVTGQYPAAVAFEPPPGLEVVSIAPAEVTVNVVNLAPSIPATPAPTAAATPAPIATP